MKLQKNRQSLCSKKKKKGNIPIGPDPTTASIQMRIATCKLLVAVTRDARHTKNQSGETN